MTKEELKRTLENACLLQAKINAAQKNLKEETEKITAWFEAHPEQTTLSCGRGIAELSFRNSYKVITDSPNLPNAVAMGIVEEKASKVTYTATAAGRKEAEKWSDVFEVMTSTSLAITPSGVKL